MNNLFDLKDPIDIYLFLLCQEVQNIFLTCKLILTTDLLKKHQNLNPVTRQKKSWHNHKTKPLKAISLSWKTKQ